MAEWKPLKTRVDDVFANEDSHAYAEEYLKGIRDVFAKGEAQFQRQLLQFFLFFFIFEMLIQSAITEITVGPAKLSDLSIILKVTPIVLAYTYQQLLTIFAHRLVLSKLIDEFFNKLHPVYYKNDLETFLMPFSTITLIRIGLLREGLQQKVLSASAFLLFFVILFGCLLLIVYSFVRLFLEFGFFDVLTWVALVICVFLAIQSWVILVTLGDFT